MLDVALKEFALCLKLLNIQDVSRPTTASLSLKLLDIKKNTSNVPFYSGI